IDAQEPIHLVVDESGQDTRRKPERTGDNQQVGEHRAGVPEQVPVRTRLILPGVSPVDAGEQDGRRPARRRVVGGGRREPRADVAGARAGEREAAGTKWIEPGLEAGAPAPRYVPLGLEERPRRRRGAKEPLAAARIRLLLRPAGGVIENRRELAEAELRRGGRPPRRGRPGGARPRIEPPGARNPPEIPGGPARRTPAVPPWPLATRPHPR